MTFGSTLLLSCGTLITCLNSPLRSHFSTLWSHQKDWKINYWELLWLKKGKSFELLYFLPAVSIAQVYFVLIFFQTWPWRRKTGADSTECCKQETVERDWGQDSGNIVLFRREHLRGRDSYPNFRFVKGEDTIFVIPCKPESRNFSILRKRNDHTQIVRWGFFLPKTSFARMNAYLIEAVTGLHFFSDVHFGLSFHSWIGDTWL